jgi:hypothetical protein
MSDDESDDNYELYEDDDLFRVLDDDMLHHSSDGDVYIRSAILDEFIDGGRIDDEYLNIKDDYGNTPLIILCSIPDLSIDEDTLKLFLNDNINHQNRYGDTALHEIAHRYCNDHDGFRNLNAWGIYEITMLLLEYGADLHMPNNEGVTPFQMFQECSTRYNNDNPRGKLFNKIVDLESTKEPEI